METDRGEPPLAQLLADPLTRSLMAADRVDPCALRQLLAAAQRRIAEAERPAPTRL